MGIKQFRLRKLLLILLGLLFLVLDSKPVMHYIGVILQETSHPDDVKAQGSAVFILIFGVIPTVLFCATACKNYTQYITNFDRMALLKKWGLTEAEEEYA